MSASVAKPLLYGASVSITALAALLAIAIETLVTPDHPGHIAVPTFLVGVIITAKFCHLGPGLLCAVLSYLTTDYLFIPPLHSVDVGWNDMPLVGSFLLTAGLVDTLNQRRWQAQKALELSKQKMRFAQTIQQRLFPRCAPLLPDFDIAGASFPAEATGGDYFDYIPMRGGAVGIVLGDVSGHGFGSALLMAETRAYLRALVLTRDDVGEILTLTNRILTDDTHDEHFMTLFFARLDPDNRSIIYAGAGHEAYLLSASGKTRKLPSTSIPLGLDKNTVVPCAGPIELAPGNILVLITDGFSEQRARGGALFGTTRALEVVHAHRSRKAGAIIEDLFKAARSFSEHRGQDDDMTAVIVKRKLVT
jgi:sigma-B regulation protein RsbU (phosphoserine phosphatase)